MAIVQVISNLSYWLVVANVLQLSSAQPKSNVQIRRLGTVSVCSSCVVRHAKAPLCLEPVYTIYARTKYRRLPLKVLIKSILTTTRIMTSHPAFPNQRQRTLSYVQRKPHPDT